MSGSRSLIMNSRAFIPTEFDAGDTGEGLAIDSHHEEIEPYVRLWRAVLEQAVVDALVGSEDALEWFLDREAVEYVCDLARLDSRVLVEWAEGQGIEVGRWI